jgi:hypothetical protein
MDTVDAASPLRRVLPFLSEHIGGAAGLAGGTVGFVVRLRTFSQKGLLVVGRALTDRYGIRPVVLTGAFCASTDSAESGTPSGCGRGWSVAVQSGPFLALCCAYLLTYNQALSRSAREVERG